MATALNILLHLLLVGTLALLILAMIQLVIAEQDFGERMVRTIALTAGAVVALGAEASGVGFTSFTVDALTGVRPAGSGVEFLAVLVPGGIGIALGWYFIHVIKRSMIKGMRWVAFFGMLAAIAFTSIYAAATTTEGVMLGSAAIPNASFIAGIALTVVVFFPEPEPGGPLSKAPIDMFRRAIRRPANSAENSPDQDPAASA